MNISSSIQRHGAIAIVILTMAAALGGVAAPSYAQSSVVTNADDGGPGSLRQALIDTAPGGTVEFDLPPDTVITVSSQLHVNKPLTINGSSAANLSVSGGNATRVFYVTAPATLIGFTVKDGAAVDLPDVVFGPRGGGINFIATHYNDTLVLRDMRLRDNVAGAQGGGLAAIGKVDVSSSVFRDNLGHDTGGGIFVTGSMSLADSQIIGNIANSGGGIYLEPYEKVSLEIATPVPPYGAPGGISRMTGSLIEGNIARTNSGGGIMVKSAGTLEIEKSRFVGNRAAINGGAGLIGTTQALIGAGVINGTDLRIRYSQFIGNNANGLGGALHTTYAGGVIENALFARNRGVGAVVYVYRPGTLLINHTTITELNQAESVAIRVYGTNGSVTVKNSIIANSEIGIWQQLRSFVYERNNLFYGNTQDRKGAVRQLGGSISGDPAFVNVGADDYRLGAGSAAVDAAGTSALTTDFEDDARPQGAAPDIGFDEAR